MGPSTQTSFVPCIRWNPCRHSRNLEAGLLGGAVDTVMTASLPDAACTQHQPEDLAGTVQRVGAGLAARRQAAGLVRPLGTVVAELPLQLGHLVCGVSGFGSDPV